MSAVAHLRDSRATIATIHKSAATIAMFRPETAKR